MKKIKIVFLFFLVFGVPSAGSYLWLTQVDNDITEQDVIAISKALKISPLVNIDYEKISFEEQIDFIRSVQRSILDNVPINSGIPHGLPREPNDLMDLGEGLCFDRSRFIEKALRHHGYETRHVAIYSTAETNSAIKSLLTPQISSHAVTEVKTLRGWLVVDSNELWISLDKGYQPLSIDELSELDASDMEKKLISQPEIPIYSGGFTFVYGLYSRHGMFYPPFDRVPDINFFEFKDNLSRFFI